MINANCRKCATVFAPVWIYCICAVAAPAQTSVQGFQSSEDRHRLTQPTTPAGDNPLATIAVQSLKATREKPLFSPSRRPPPPIVSETPETRDATPMPERPQITLVGVIYSPDLQIGVFINESGKTLIRARVGESVLGWKVHAVDRRAVTLEKANDRLKLELKALPHNTQAMAESQESGAPLQGTPVEPIKPFATAKHDW